MAYKKFGKLALVMISIVAMAMPLMVAAQPIPDPDPLPDPDPPPVVAPVVPVAGATSYTVEPIGSQLGTGEADLKTTIVNILQWFLGILALIAVVLVIYGGFVWLTAAGNEENVDKAKKIISAAVIGLIVVLLAWAIVIFVARTTVNQTNTA